MDQANKSHYDDKYKSNIILTTAALVVEDNATVQSLCKVLNDMGDTTIQIAEGIQQQYQKVDINMTTEDINKKLSKIVKVN